MPELGNTKPLSELQKGLLHTKSREIADAPYAQRIDETACGFTGLLEITNASGWNTGQLWATDYHRPSDPTTIYTLLYAEGKLASVSEWPMG